MLVCLACGLSVLLRQRNRRETRASPCCSVWERAPILPTTARCRSSRPHDPVHALDHGVGNTVLPTIKRTKEEIMTGKLRQYKARMCLVAQAPGTQQTLLVDDHVLLWYKNRFYRANQFAGAYAVIPVGDRFEVLSDASATDQRHPAVCRAHPAVLDRSNRLARRKPSHSGDHPAGSEPHTFDQAWIRKSPRSHTRLLPAGVERLLQPVE